MALQANNQPEKKMALFTKLTKQVIVVGDYLEELHTGLTYQVESFDETGNMEVIDADEKICARHANDFGLITK